MARRVRKSIGQIVFCRTVWAWETRVICHIVQLFGNYLCKYLDSAVSNSPMRWLVNAVSNCPMAGQLSVQQSNGWTVPCSTVQ